MRLRSLSRPSLFLTLAALPFPACWCIEEDINIIAPQIAVDVCKDPEIKVSGELLGGVRDCAVAFDAQPITVRTKREIQISNPSPIDLNLLSVRLEENVEFAIESMPEQIAPGLKAIGVVSYRPLVESEHNDTLIIESDAENLAEGENVVIELSGSGFDDGVPDIVVSPLECDYGRVAVNGVAQCTLTIENRGQRDLVFDDVLLLEDATVKPAEHPEGEAPFSFAGRAPSRDDALPPPPDDAGEAPQNVFDLTVRFLPLALGNYQGMIAIRSNDPDSSEILVPLAGIGVTPPTCAARLKSVNNVPYTNDIAIEPLDDVVLTAEDSTASTQDGAITDVHWRVLDAPPGSTAILTNPDGVDTGFTFANGVLGIDLAGRYKACAIVVDDQGTDSVNECCVEFEAIPTDTILVQLSWDTSFGDMDLHFLMENGGEFCGSSGLSYENDSLADSCGTDFSCYYANCKASNSARPDWDEDNVSGSEGDPSLDIDDLCGFGPENINIDIAQPGSYLVGVDFFGFTGCSGSGRVGNTVRIYLYGALQAEFFRDLDNGDWWEVALIHWPGTGGGAPCIEDLNDTEEQCPGM